MSESFAGIDVSRDHLDLHERPGGRSRPYPNDDAGVQALGTRLAELAPTRMVAPAYV